MGRYTESGLRSLVRQLLMEATGTKATVNITNKTKSPVEVDGVYAAPDTENESDLLDDFTDPQQIAPGASLAVDFTPTDDSTAFKVAISRLGATGVTPDYVRKTGAFSFTISGNKGSATVESFGDAADEGDDVQMTDAEIAALARQAGEQYEIVEDPTDPEFVYAVYYTVAPTRAVVVRAPEEDYKGENIVSSKGQEISPRRYAGSFRKVAQALMDKMKEAHPAVEVAEAPSDK